MLYGFWSFYMICFPFMIYVKLIQIRHFKVIHKFKKITKALLPYIWAKTFYILVRLSTSYDILNYY